MTVAFVDTSALAKRYDKREAGSGDIAALCEDSRVQVLVSVLTRLEMASVLAHKGREGKLSPARQVQAWDLFQADYELEYTVVPLDDAVIDGSEELLFRYALRTWDAVQIATACMAAGTIAPIDDLLFVTADRQQAAAAAGEGLDIRLVG